MSMYILFNRDGSLKATNLSDVIVKGENLQKAVFIGVEGLETTDDYSAEVDVQLPAVDTDPVAVAVFTDTRTISGITYKGWGLPITTDITVYEGIDLASLVIIDEIAGSTFVSYNFKLVINPSVTAEQETEVNISLAQYRLLSNALNQRVAKVGVANRLYGTDENASDTTYPIDYYQDWVIYYTNRNTIKKFTVESTDTLEDIYNATSDFRRFVLHVNHTAKDYYAGISEVPPSNCAITLYELDGTKYYSGTYAKTLSIGDVLGMLPEHELASKEWVNDQLSGKQDTLTFDITPTEDSTNPVTSGGIKAYVDAVEAQLGGGLKFKGAKSVSQLNALSPSLTTSNNGDYYNVTDSGTLSAGSLPVLAGDNVAWSGTEWTKLAGMLDAAAFVNIATVSDTTDYVDDYLFSYGNPCVVIVSGKVYLVSNYGSDPYIYYTAYELLNPEVSFQINGVGYHTATWADLLDNSHKVVLPRRNQVCAYYDYYVDETKTLAQLYSFIQIGNGYNEGIPCVIRIGGIIAPANTYLVQIWKQEGTTNYTFTIFPLLTEAGALAVKRWNKRYQGFYVAGTTTLSTILANGSAYELSYVDTQLYKHHISTDSGNFYFDIISTTSSAAATDAAVITLAQSAIAILKDGSTCKYLNLTSGRELYYIDHSGTLTYDSYQSFDSDTVTEL